MLNKIVDIVDWKSIKSHASTQKRCDEDWHMFQLWCRFSHAESICRSVHLSAFLTSLPSALVVRTDWRVVRVWLSICQVGSEKINFNPSELYQTWFDVRLGKEKFFKHRGGGHSDWQIFQKVTICTETSDNCQKFTKVVKNLRQFTEILIFRCGCPLVKFTSFLFRFFHHFQLF